MWAPLVPRACWPDGVRGRHDDWWGPLARIPRAWNAWLSEAEPRKLLGTERPEDRVDVPEPGKWVLATAWGAFGIGWWALAVAVWILAGFPLPPPLHFSVRIRGWLVRLSVVRYDFNGRFYTGPSATVKRQ